MCRFAFMYLCYIVFSDTLAQARPKNMNLEVYSSCMYDVEQC